MQKCKKSCAPSTPSLRRTTFCMFAFLHFCICVYVYKGPLVTSSTTFATKAVFYSDTGCSSEISSMVTGYNEVSVGDNVTGLTTSVGSSTYPSHASRVTYKESCSKMKGTTDVGTAYLNALLSTSWVTTGETYTCQGSGRTTYALVAYDNSSVFWERLHSETSSTAYPTDWSSNTDSTTKL